jgi:Nucleotidyl transferase AbiEii toxin, Type IV TA system
MSKPFLHLLADFKDLIEITARDEKIQDPSLVEKDYWLMHVLWGLQQLGLQFHLKGGTSLSKGFGCIHRFSEDIDLKIEPVEKLCGFKVYANKNHDDEKHRESRKKYFEWVCNKISGKIPGIVETKRDPLFDDVTKFRNAGVRLFYQSSFTQTPGLKEGILLEVGFDRTAPNVPRDITSWAYERASHTSGVSVLDNRAKGVPCYEPKYTF